MFKVYSKPNCQQCNQAKALLSANDIQYKEIYIDIGQAKDSNLEYISLAELKTLFPAATSAPQIMRSNEIIGSYYDLKKYLNK